MVLGAIAIPQATATTIETFDFTLSDFGTSDGFAMGTFSGTPEANGSIQLADLTTFMLLFTVDHLAPYMSIGNELDGYSLGNLQFFSFQPGADGPNSSFDFQATSNTAANLCVGAAAAFGLCGVGGDFAAVATSVLSTPQNPLFYESAQFANVTLQQPLPATLGGNPVGIAPGGPVTGTPEPGTLGLCGVVLMGLRLWRRRTEHSSCH